MALQRGLEQDCYSGLSLVLSEEVHFCLHLFKKIPHNHLQCLFLWILFMPL